jgi:hypothetical protein
MIYKESKFVYYSSAGWEAQGQRWRGASDEGLLADGDSVQSHEPAQGHHMARGAYKRQCQTEFSIRPTLKRDY